jgi:hypothetical protein
VDPFAPTPTQFGAFGEPPTGQQPADPFSTFAPTPTQFGAFGESPTGTPTPSSDHNPARDLAAKGIDGAGSIYKGLGTYINSGNTAATAAHLAEKVGLSQTSSLLGRAAETLPKVGGFAARTLGGIGAAFNAGADLIQHGQPANADDWRAFGIKNGIEAVPVLGGIAGLTGVSSWAANRFTSSGRYR